LIYLHQKDINKYVLFSLVAVFSINCFHQKIPAKLNLDFNNSLILSDESHFKNMSQLTFSGENAEAYFSADGKKLIFQAHDGDSLCDQIYIMDIESRSIKLVSTGNGVTTCSFFKYPNDNGIIYSSTHMDDPDCPPKPDFSKGYIWKLYPGFDIYEAGLSGLSPRPLTSSPGYDAEATYSFDGKKIIYTSLISGDLDLWYMNPDGSGKQQLTNRLGYDGGAFYSYDAKKIVWRAYYPETEEEIINYKSLLKENSIRPMALQIWTMNANGTNKKQITDNNSANFGPIYFPKADKIIFSSNMHDPKGRDFDLYSINIDGSDLERITYFEGFDGFPMFSPNGQYLVFASNRNQNKRGDTNIFICEWK
jgi:Tol biopolymer transport system component